MPVAPPALTNLCERGDFNNEFIGAVSRCKRTLVGVRCAGAKHERRNWLLPFRGKTDAEVTVGRGDDEDFFVLERKAWKCGGVGSSSCSSCCSRRRVFGLEGNGIHGHDKYL